MDYKRFSSNVINGVGNYEAGQFKLKENSSFIICGRTGSGKSTFISKLLENAHIMFENKHNREIEILYCYSTSQDMFDEMEAKLPKIRFISG